MEMVISSCDKKKEGTLPLKEKAACATYKTKQQEIPLGKAQILQCFTFVPFKEIPYTR
jgi:hypothetical protein